MGLKGMLINVPKVGKKKRFAQFNIIGLACQGLQVAAHTRASTQTHRLKCGVSLSSCDELANCLLTALDATVRLRVLRRGVAFDRHRAQ